MDYISMITPNTDRLIENIKEPKVIAAVAGVTTATLLTAYLIKSRTKIPKKGKYYNATLPKDAYDAVIVGAGPSGSTMGYYSVKGGAKVCICEKEKFPRDKYCGDAVCTPAIRILEEMGVMDELREANEVQFANAGGFVSPFGYCYIGESVAKIGEAAACAVKRIHLDERMAKCAQRAGAELKEGYEVDSASFDKETGLWSVMSTNGNKIYGRILVCADGATSRLATKLGYCTEHPKGICSRAYVESGTHNANFDGVCFYQKESLPGYSAIFKHPNDELNYCYYLIPAGKEGMCGNVKESDLPRLHNEAVKNDPFISRALGPIPKMERMKAASLRLGCQGIKQSYDDHLLIIGDAAGHIDPLTGEGIHTAMMGGKAAAECLLLMCKTGDYTKKSTKVYKDKWMKAYGYDFGMSRKAANLIWNYPFLLDACAKEMERKGDSMMARWAEVMTCMRPKSYFLRPDVALPILYAAGKEYINQNILKKPCLYVKLPLPKNNHNHLH